MATEIDYSLAFMTGILGSGHCMGMCGALVSGFFMKSPQKSYLPYFVYHLARIFIYTVIGVIAASLGVALVATGLVGKIQGFMQLLLGFVVIVLALGILGVTPWQFSMRLLPLAWLRKGFAKAASSGSTKGALLGGLVNGCMPCPLTFAMAVSATAAPTPLHGGLLMLALGAGTLPSMLFVSLAFGKVGTKLRGYMLKTAALVMIVMGLNTMYRGITFLGDRVHGEHVMSAIAG